jgi:hypothetical protein
MLIAGVMTVGTAGATLTGTTFEGDDGNTIVNTAGNQDWVNAPNLSIQTDQATGQCDNSYTQGSKEDDTNVVIGLGSIPNSKADLGKFGVASETRPNGDVFMYLAWTRNNLSGTTNFDFEINQLAQPSMTLACGSADKAITLLRRGDATASNTPGGSIPDDLLISYDIQGGSQTPTLSFRRWTGTAWSNPVTLSSTNSEGKINSSPVTFDSVSYPAAAFGEASINLTGAGIIPNQNTPGASCVAFGSAYVKSRASSSFTAQMKDYIAPASIGLDNCGSITIDKVTVPAGDTTQFSFDGTPAAPKAQLADFQLADATAPRVFSGLNAGNYAVSETVPTGWDLTNLTCNDSNGTIVGSTANITLDANEDVTCTYTNTKRGSIKIVKQSDPDGTAFTMNPTGFNGNASFQLTDTGAAGGASQAFTNIVPTTTTGGPYSISETLPSGWEQQSATCSAGTIGAIVVNPGQETTCTFVNQARGHIIVIKQTDPAEEGVIPEAQQTSFAFDAVGGAYADFSLTDDGINDQELVPGSYSVSETAPSGWEQSGVTCNDNDATNDPGHLDLQAGETITCIFSNEADASITLVKQTLNGEAGSFTIVTSGDGTDFDGSQTLTVPGDPSHTVTPLDPGTYSAIETVPAGWVLKSSSCVNDANTGTIHLAAGEHEICTYVNELQIGSITIHKQSIKTTGDGQGGTVNIPMAGVQFTVAGFAPKSTDQFGNVCFDRIPFDPVNGTSYQVTETTPNGFFDIAPFSVTVNNVSYCGDGLGEAKTVENTPKTNISVSVDSVVTPALGGTESTVDCVDASDTSVAGGSTSPATGDGTFSNAVALVPGTYVCTIIIDP